jgi:hypothetical protein
MTLFEVEELARYWIAHPPVHLLIAACLGLGGKEPGRQEPHRWPAVADPSPAAAQLLAGLGPGFTRGDVHSGLGPAVVDFDKLRRRSNDPDQDRRARGG